MRVAVCRRAKQVVEEAAASGKLAPYGGGARVVYGHTDSLFLHLPQVRCMPTAATSAAVLSCRLGLACMESLHWRHCRRTERWSGRWSDVAPKPMLGLRMSLHSTRSVLSLWLHPSPLQAADARQAIAAGRLASKLVTAAFPPPMELKFERVCHPFLLLHVNR